MQKSLEKCSALIRTDRREVKVTFYHQLMAYSFLFRMIYNRLFLSISNINDTCQKRSTITTYLELLL